MKKIYCLLIICVLCLAGCGRAKYWNNEADDMVSEAIAAVIDSEDIYYQGKSVVSKDVIVYEYLIMHEEQGQIEPIIDTVNELIETESISEKITIDFWIPLPGGAGRVAMFMNYSDENLERPDYNALQGLCIYGDHESMYTEPRTYVQFDDIRKLRIKPEIQKRAEAEGIEWYEYWPNLESVEIKER